MTSSTVREAFAEASTLFLHTVAATPTADLARPALGSWTVRDLIGHTSRAWITIETYLAKPPPALEVVSAADYYRRVREDAFDPVDIARRAGAAAAALEPDVLDALGVIRHRVAALVRATPDDRIIATILGGMRFDDYLSTRVVELVVHTLDLARAVDGMITLPTHAAAAVLPILADLATGPEHAPDVILALTGRVALPPGFSLL